MMKFLKHIIYAVGMGLTWAAGWALTGMLGVVIFYSLFPRTPDIFDIWFPVFAYPGFFGGVIFFEILRGAERGHRLDDLFLPRIAAWGAVAGLLPGVFPFALGTTIAKFSLWLLGATIFGTAIVLGTVSAVGSALLLRILRAKNLLRI